MKVLLAICATAAVISIADTCKQFMKHSQRFQELECGSVADYSATDPDSIRLNISPKVTEASVCTDSCSNLVDKVCATDGSWYTNECFLDCAGVVKYSGTLADCPCPLTKIDLQVCGADGNRYASKDHLACIGVQPSDDESVCPPKTGGIF